jgi:hypothetical protein
MKKLVLALSLLPVLAIADNVTFIGADYARASGFGESVDGYQIGVKSVFDGKVDATLSYTKLSEGGASADATGLTVNYGFGNFSEGSFYAGAGYVDGSGSGEGSLQLGYAKTSGGGFDYDVGIFNVDGETSAQAKVRGQIGDGGLGWSVGLSHDGDISAQTAGINYRF